MGEITKFPTHLARDQYLSLGQSFGSLSPTNGAGLQNDLFELGARKSAERHAAAVDYLFQGDGGDRRLQGSFRKTTAVSNGDDDDDLDRIKDAAGRHTSSDVAADESCDSFFAKPKATILPGR